jgi:pyruvate, orthophosphate dikinase
MSSKYVYFFGDGKAEGSKGMKDLLGGKGANLHEMTHLGLNVPAGFTISTEVCTYFYKNESQYPKDLALQVKDSLARVEKSLGKRFGDARNPLLVSVRSGARASMPGMMDTVLNLGLNDETVQGLAEQTGNARFAYDAYRRFIQMYSDVVLGVGSFRFESLLEHSRRIRNVMADSELNLEELQALVKKYKSVVLEETGKPFPMDPTEQLWGSIGAVFGSWMASRAISYRRIHRLPDDWGTAVNVQSMVFGNMGEDSATGVAFTRDPSTGENRFFGEFLPNAQGEDVVAGIRTPMPINLTSAAGSGLKTLEELFPKNYAELVKTYQFLEKTFRDMQDIEFTIEKGRLFILQTRTGKRTASAAVRTAVEMVAEGLIGEEEAVLRVTPEQVEQLLHPRLDPRANKTVIAKGLPASPGAACGEVVFSSEEAEVLRKNKKPALLVRHETSPEDIGGMDAAEGILTALGGMTSHAAVVARGMGKPCVAGCGAINIDYSKQQFTVGERTVKRGDFLTIDGSTGEVIVGRVPTINSQLDVYFSKFMSWVDKRRTLGVRANADTPNDAKVARGFGAEGVGLCRTEHMFFEDTRINVVREMILANHKNERETALAKLFPMQKEDFIGIFREMKGLPVTIRLLDPPLHEFLPKTKSEAEGVASILKVSVDSLMEKVRSLHEFNPMLGHRGCRLGISYPEIYEMQTRAIMEAACELTRMNGFEIEPEIMVPFVVTVEEFRMLKANIEKVCKDVCDKYQTPVKYKVGTMIEIPRAAIVADKIAEIADFFSFGTNDLTQMTLGLSRDDAGSFLPSYVDKGIFTKDPFVSVDQEGVGELMKIAAERGKKGNSDLKLGICGEQGGDTATIEFCHRLGLNYVSCSPFRVPVARLAAAQAALKS